MEIDSEIKSSSKISNSYSRNELLNSICSMMRTQINIAPCLGIAPIIELCFRKIEMKKIPSMRNIKKALLRKTNTAFKLTDIGKIHKAIIIIMISYKTLAKIPARTEIY